MPRNTRYSLTHRILLQTKICGVFFIAANAFSRKMRTFLSRTESYSESACPNFSNANTCQKSSKGLRFLRGLQTSNQALIMRWFVLASGRRTASAETPKHLSPRPHNTNGRISSIQSYQKVCLVRRLYRTSQHPFDACVNDAGHSER